MKNRPLLAILIAAAACACTPPACLSQANTNDTAKKVDLSSLPGVDARVAALLNAEQTKYSVDQDGDYMIICGLASNQTQTVWIDSQTSRFGELEIRRIWSIAYTSDHPFTAEFTETLLERNAVIKIGAWSVHKDPDGHHVVVFSVKVDASNQKASSLDDMIDFVAFTANGMGDEIRKSLDGHTKVWSPYDEKSPQ